MKLICYGQPGQENLGVILHNQYYDVSALGEDYNESFFVTNGLQRPAQFLGEHKSQLPQISAGERLGPPAARPSKILCIGLSYADHARKTGTTPNLIFKIPLASS
jgi:2-keto-4-pentenoate hydratase/2-oxohepta-3-ene-1,7-dioic acid hydratase in catechol pathway